MDIRDLKRMLLELYRSTCAPIILRDKILDSWYVISHSIPFPCYPRKKQAQFLQECV